MIDYKPTIKKDIAGAFGEFWKLVTLLRSPEGCPWDREQTTKDLIPSLFGEVYEYIDSLDEDKKAETEELGDIMLNIISIMQTSAAERGVDPVEALNVGIDKIYRRHTHVFGKESADSSKDVVKIWAEQKKKEGKGEDKDDYFSRLPKSMNAFSRTTELHKKVRKVGFDWDKPEEIYLKVQEELKEVEKAVNTETRDEIEMECGDLIFAAIALATKLGINPEIAIKRSNAKFEKRFNKVRSIAEERGIPLDKEHFKQLDAIWDEVKLKENN